MSDPLPYSVVVEATAADDGRRVDVTLAGHVVGLSRRRASALARSGQVRVNGRPVRKGVRVVEGDRIEALLATADEATHPAGSAPSEIAVLLARDDIVVVDKPAGMPCQPLSPGEAGTLVQRVAERFPEVLGTGLDPLHGGLLHRIDVHTSGAVALARSPDHFARWRPRFVQGRVRKIYLAVVETPSHAAPIPDRGQLDLPIARAPGHSGRVIVCGGGSERYRGTPMEAHTDVTLLSRSPDCAVVEAAIHRGRPHQIRAHLAAAGWPIVGDPTYGAPSVDIGRSALHAYCIELGTAVASHAVCAPIPEDMRRLCQRRGLSLPTALTASGEPPADE